MPGPTLEFIGTIVATLLTIMVLSYLIGDNAFFRLASYLFVGVASGYAGAIAWHNVIRPVLVDPLIRFGPSGLLTREGVGTLLIPWILSLLMLLKLSPRTTRFGGLPVALVVGVGAAVVVGGGITGTLLPQALAAGEALGPEAMIPAVGEPIAGWAERLISGLVLFMATLSTLMYFRFGARREATGRVHRSRFTQGMAYMGRIFIALTFGVMYAGAMTASILILAERMHFLRDVVIGWMGG